MRTLLRCLLKGIVLLWCCLDCFQSANVPNTNRDLEHQAGQPQWNANEINERKEGFDIPDWVLSGKPPPETEPPSETATPPPPPSRPAVEYGGPYCPPLFSIADTLFCNGECGTDFEGGDDDETSEHGCAQGDADAFCKLKLCDGGANATSFDVTKAEPGVPGFACDMCNHRRKRRQNKCKNNLESFESVHEGTFFGIVDVYFTNSTLETHGGTYSGAGDVISNVVCRPSKPLHSEYKIYINAEKKTCKNIGQKIGNNVKGQDESECRKRCSDEKDCKFFYYNVNRNCVLFSSCAQFRTPHNIGTTYAKQAIDYVKKDNSYCLPDFCNDLTANSLMEAKEKCTNDTACVMFYDVGSNGNSFCLCKEGAKLVEHSGETLYIKG